MRRIGTVDALATGSAAGMAAAAAVARRARRRRISEDRWHSVTSNREPEAVGALPQPLHDLARRCRCGYGPRPAAGAPSSPRERLTPEPEFAP